MAYRLRAHAREQWNGDAVAPPAASHIGWNGDHHAPCLAPPQLHAAGRNAPPSHRSGATPSSRSSSEAVHPAAMHPAAPASTQRGDNCDNSDHDGPSYATAAPAIDAATGVPLFCLAGPLDGHMRRLAAAPSLPSAASSAPDSRSATPATRDIFRQKTPPPTGAGVQYPARGGIMSPQWPSSSDDDGDDDGGAADAPPRSTAWRSNASQALSGFSAVQPYRAAIPPRGRAVDADVPRGIYVVDAAGGGRDDASSAGDARVLQNFRDSDRRAAERRATIAAQPIMAVRYTSPRPAPRWRHEAPTTQQPGVAGWRPRDFGARLDCHGATTRAQHRRGADALGN
jgi:hypothetical protein